MLIRMINLNILPNLTLHIHLVMCSTVLELKFQNLWIQKLMDTIKIKFESGNGYKLPDISSEKFDEFMWGSGDSEFEYEKYKRENRMIELTDFNSQTTDEITLVVEQSWRGRVLKFKCVYDSDNDENFDEKDYFGEQE